MELVSNWIVNNPEYSGIIVFIITFIETFAFVGALVPGVLVLFAASALIGGNQAVGLFELIVIAGIATAISNSLSFFWGYSLRHRIEQIPFLKRHQSVLDRSAAFFDRWGPLSIMVGRFIGPVRPFVAFAAGTLSFSPRRFVLFDFIAIIAWSPVYIVPGYLTGMAVDGFIPSPEQWPTLLLLSFISTVALVAFVTGNYWLQAHQPGARKLAKRIHVDELPLASSLLLIVITILYLSLETPFPLDSAIGAGLDQLMQPWGLQLAKTIIFLSDPQLLILQTVLISLFLFLSRQIIAAILIFTVASASLINYQIPLTVSHSDLAIETAIFSILIGSLTSLFCESIHPTKRWLFYIIAVLLVIIHSIALLASSRYSLTQISLGIFWGVGANAIIRICYSFIRRQNFRINAALWPVLVLLTLTTISYVAINVSLV